jgi:cold shock CspA family protein
MAKGTIRRLTADRGFGFIRTAEGTDLFFHRKELQGGGLEGRWHVA